MQTKAEIMREPLLPELKEFGLDLESLNLICDTVEKMNDDHLLVVVGDTLLDIRDILRLDEGDARVNHFAAEIEARYKAVVHNIKIWSGYGATHQFQADAKLKRVNDLKSLLKPLIDQAIELRTNAEAEPTVN